ncbi:transposase, partial [Acinetobacter sp.]|uniref:transposase n=1 Tax=Acinetobacter sp. TaxID=472 RepID=UPI002FCA4700
MDESGFQSESTRPHSYSRKGVRAEGEFNWHLKNCSNAIGALIENRLLTVGVFDCSVNTAVFESWIEQDLLPKLKEPSVLIMDNAAFHKGKRLQELVRCSGHYIVWLPK